MGFFKNALKGATSLNPKKSAKHFVGSIVDPAGTTIREGRGKDSLPTNAKGYYDPAGALTPKVIKAKRSTASPQAPVVLPPIGQKAQKAPPLPGMTLSSPKMAPTSMQALVAQSSRMPTTPGASRSLNKTAAAPAYTPAAAPAAVPARAAHYAPAPSAAAPGLK